MRQDGEARQVVSTASSKLSEWLQAMANVTVIAVCILVAWLAVKRMGAAPNAPSSAEIYEVGESTAPVPGVDFTAAQATLVMVLREDCHFCQESVPFYRQLSEARLTNPNSAVRVVVASTDPQDALSAYLQSKEIHVDAVATIKPGALKVPGTPSLVLVDRGGKEMRHLRMDGRSLRLQLRDKPVGPPGVWQRLGGRH